MVLRTLKDYKKEKAKMQKQSLKIKKYPGPAYALYWYISPLIYSWVMSTHKNHPLLCHQAAQAMPFGTPLLW
jgi:hypothetical protein